MSKINFTIFYNLYNNTSTSTKTKKEKMFKYMK